MKIVLAPRRSSRLVQWLVLALLGTSALVGLPHAQAASDVGYRDFSYGTGTTAPTADKPQSKLWYTDGKWWGSLFSPSSQSFTIHRLDWTTQSWTDTGVLVDERAKAKVDALWDGGKLYVAAAGPSSTSTTDSTRVTRYSYVNGQYVRDEDPVILVEGGSESIVIDRDTKGTLWATYTRGGKVYVTHSRTDSSAWITPYVLPVAGAGDVSADDISALVAFGGRIGVLWGNQNANSPSGNSYWFAVHKDGTDDSAGSWTRELAYGGDKNVENADDHMNIKSLQTDSEGRIFASVKTSLNDGTDPLIVLLVRSPTGTWDTDNVYGRGSENHTRAIVLLDDTNKEAHVFAASPCCSGGVVYHKKASFSALANGNPFASGQGAPFIRSSTDTTINNPTSTKQTLNGTTGLVVLASDDNTRYYLHNRLDLADPDTVVPDTRIDSGPNGKVGSTSATFTFSSDNTAATFECRLDGAAYAACVSPKEYAGLLPGSHTFDVRAVTSAGPDPTPASRTWTIDESVPTTFPAAADAPVKKGSPDTNYGTATTLLADTSPTEESYLRFDVSGMADNKVTAAKLRLYITNGSTNGPAVYTTAGATWAENSITWNNRPARATTALENKASVSAKAWVEYDVTPAVTGDGAYGFAFVPDSSDGTDANSREATGNRPELVVSISADTTPPGTTIDAQPEATTTTNTASFTFSASEAGSTFECKLDTGAFEACTSPKDYTGLANGDHVFSVRATDSAGNTDSTPASASWTQAVADTGAPETTITSAPSGTVNSSEASVEFTANEPSTFQCRLDGAAFAACESPMHYIDLPDGSHTFSVRAIDSGGNVDETPAEASWTVSTGTMFKDGFESAGFGAWTVKTGGDGSATVQGDVVKDGAFAARLSASANTGSVSYARRGLDATAELTISQDVQVAVEGVSGGNVPLLRLLDGNAARVLSLYRQNLAKDKVYVSYGGTAYLTKALLPLGTWARVDVHLKLAGSGSSLVEIVVDGQKVHENAAATVTDAVRQIQLGNETAKQTFVLYADNVLVSKPLA